jgi:uncharacterized delta-60 repeat protein
MYPASDPANGGKIVVGGTLNDGVSNHFAAARFTTAGQPDPAFGTGGTVVVPQIGAGADDESFSLALDSHGRVVLAGFSKNAAGDRKIVVYRMNANGTPDSSFGTAGAVTLATVASPAPAAGAGDDEAFGVAVDANDNILVAGTSAKAAVNAFTRYLPVLARLKAANGSLDTSFNKTGIYSSPLGAFNDQLLSVLVQPDGKILAAGWSETQGTDDAIAVRFNADGSLDIP